MTVTMCIKYPKQLHDEFELNIRRKTSLNNVARKNDTPKNTSAAMQGRRIITHPYLNNNSNNKANQNISLAHIRKAVNKISADKEESTFSQEKLVPVVKIEQVEKPVKQVPVAANPSSGVDAFIAIMVHASKCKSCPQLSCRKMRIVLQHYIRCGRLVSGQTCLVCKQLLDIVTKHATLFCLAGAGNPCPVPLCDDLRRSSMQGLETLKQEKQEDAPMTTTFST